MCSVPSEGKSWAQIQLGTLGYFMSSCMSRSTGLKTSCAPRPSTSRWAQAWYFASFNFYINYVKQLPFFFYPIAEHMGAHVAQWLAWGPQKGFSCLGQRLENVLSAYTAHQEVVGCSLSQLFTLTIAHIQHSSLCVFALKFRNVDTTGINQ